MEKNLQSQAHSLLKALSNLVEEIKTSNLQNEQWALDWIDEVNKLSVEF